MHPSPPCIYIPIHNSQEEVQIFLNDLPRAEDLLDVLRTEQPPLDIWLALAREYFKQGRTDEFLGLLSEGSSPEMDEAYAHVTDERIAILNALGAHYTNLGRSRRRGDRSKDDHLIKAVELYNRSSRVDKEAPSTWVGKGNVQMYKGEWNQALEFFKLALTQSPDYAPALLGKACISFNKGQYEDALELYRRVLRGHPHCPPPVRLGIGLCHMRMHERQQQKLLQQQQQQQQQQAHSQRVPQKIGGTGEGGQGFHAVKARQAFERVLALEPENVDALVALAVMDINSKQPQDVKMAMARFLRAYEVHPFNAMALNHLASHCVGGGRLEAVEALAQAVAESTEHPLLRSESYYNRARAAHALGRLDNAIALYNAACQVADLHEFPLPYLGKCQALLALGRVQEAADGAERVLAAFPRDADTLKLLASIRLQEGKGAQGVALLERLTERHPKDRDGWLELGEALVASDPPAALAAFRKAVDLDKKRGRAVPWQLVNNIAVLQQEQGQLDAARASYEEAGGAEFVESVRLVREQGGQAQAQEEGGGGGGQEAAFVPPKGALLHPDQVTLVFNLALLHERQHETGAAGRLYRWILHAFPGYTDCHVRLAVLAKGRGDSAGCLAHISSALQSAPNDPQALLLRSEVECGEDGGSGVEKGKATVKRVLETQRDAYAPALVALGNWNLRMATLEAPRRNVLKDPKLEASFLGKARELYQRALAQQPNNAYAAAGLGCVLGEKGCFDAAEEVLSRVQQTLGDGRVAQVWVNVATCHLAKGDFVKAAKLYEKCLRRFLAGTPEASRVLLYLARAHYDAEDLAACRRVLLRALHEAPSDLRLRFNLAAAMQKFGSSTLNKPKRNAGEIKQVVQLLKSALRLFSQLAAASASAPAPAPAAAAGVGAGKGKAGAMEGIDKKKMEMHIEYCKHVLDKTKQHLEVAEREEQQERQKQEVARLQLQAEAEAQREAEARRAEEERARREAEEEEAQRKEEDLRRRLEEWKRKERAMPPVGAGEDGGERGGGKGERRKKGKGSKRHKGGEDEDAAGGNWLADDEDEVRGQQENGQEGGEHAEEEEEEEEMEEEELPEEEETEARTKRGAKRARESRAEGDAKGGDTDAGGADPWEDVEEQEEEEEEQEVEPEAVKGRRRLGKGGGDGPSAADEALAAAGLQDDDDEEGEGGAGLQDEDAEGPPAPAAKRKRQLSDSDDES